MAETAERAGPTQLTASAAAIYTAPTTGTTRVWVRSIEVFNEDTAARTYTLGINTTATDAAGKRMWGYESPIGAKGFLLIEPADVLNGHATTPDLIYGLADVASKVNVKVNVVVVTA